MRTQPAPAFDPDRRRSLSRTRMQVPPIQCPLAVLVLEVLSALGTTPALTKVVGGFRHALFNLGIKDDLRQSSVFPLGVIGPMVACVSHQAVEPPGWRSGQLWREIATMVVGQPPPPPPPPHPPPHPGPTRLEIA